MPKTTDEQLKADALRFVTEHHHEYPSLSAACEAVARQVGVGRESVRRRAWRSSCERRIIPGSIG
jgi:transposase